MTKPFHPDLLQPGDTIRHYRVVRRLGRGGFAIAFLVEHEGQPYTLKMAAHPPSDDDEAREDERAFREAISLGHFRHPNLLVVHEMGRWPDLERGHFFFVTDYVPGSTFNEWRWRTHAPLCRLVGVLGEVALVLAELHERGVCHRDIKADNILVRDGDEKPFLIDFGAVFLPGAYTLTQALPPVTFHNMPPEVAAFLRSGEWEDGARLPAKPSADLYAFGALLYEALTDCHPFNPRLPPAQLLLAIEFLPPKEPMLLDPRVPPALNALVMRLLAKDPEQRPLSARAVHEELMRVLRRDVATEAWTVPYAFPAGREEELLLSGTGEVQEAPEEAGRTDERQQEAPHHATWERSLAVLALGLVLLGIGCWLIRAVCASAMEEACRGAASTSLVMPAPTEKGHTPVLTSWTDDDSSLFSAPPRPFGGICALLGACAASANLLACAGVPVRPDHGELLARCPPEALATADKMNLKGPLTDVELVTTTLAGVTESAAINIRTGPVEGWMILPDDRTYWVKGEAKVFPDRVYVQFDRIYLDQLYPTRGRVPSPICAAAVDQGSRKQFGVQTYAAFPIRGVEVDPTKVDHSPDAAVLNVPMVDTYVQRPGARFPY
ncbi:serine/threonine-protein kinase [Archangium lipolyticum]|uniref:serine/threonine-protein kinase n=1 Tax=Archangium lipolyticum TaxID=2970465 RepID=UPI00214A5CAD|nr:serine/threonine-protein kinase [Archangium lipolyticum]